MRPFGVPGVPGNPLTPRGQDPIRVPGTPPILALTDRDDGTVWYLTWGPAEDGYVKISDVPPQAKFTTQIVTYGPWEGPYLGQGARLFVRGGRLGYDVVEGEYNSPAPVARRKWVRYALRLYLHPLWRRFGDRVKYQEIEP